MEKEDLNIEKYCRDEMTAAERAAFETRLTVDSALQHQVELYHLTMEAIRLHGRELLKKQLRDSIVKPQRAYPNWFWMGIAGIFVLASAFYIYFSTFKQKSALEEQKTAPPPQEISNDSLPKIAENELLQDTASNNINIEISPNKTSNRNIAAPPQPVDNDATAQKRNQLFAENFERLETNETKDATTRSVSSSPSQTLALYDFLYQYQHKNFDTAILMYNKLPTEIKRKPDNRFYYAIALMGANKMNEASIELKEIIPQEEFNFFFQAHWYAALCDIKIGKLESAKEHLDVVAEGTIIEYREKANRLLNDLDGLQ